MTIQEKKDKMKMSVEIVNGTLMYGYEIGSSRQNGSMPLCASTLVKFVGLIELLAKHDKRVYEEFMHEACAMALLEKDPKLVKKFTERHKK